MQTEADQSRSSVAADVPGQRERRGVPTGGDGSEREIFVDYGGLSFKRNRYRVILNFDQIGVTLRGSIRSLVNLTGGSLLLIEISLIP